MSLFEHHSLRSLRAITILLFWVTFVSSASLFDNYPRKDWITHNRVHDVSRLIDLKSPDVPLPNVPRMPNDPNKCTKPRIRKEWRRLTSDEKKNYIDAIHCMKRSPPKFKKYFAGIRNRYEDFVAYHINATSMTPGTHNNGYFLPFHRYLIWNWENVLTEECNFTLSGIPFWDWSLDTPERNGSFATSPIFNNVLGFGGDGKWVDPLLNEPRCIDTGPFAQYNVTLTFRNMLDADERCVERTFSNALGEMSGSWSKTLKPILDQQNYEDFSELDFAAGPFTREKGGPHIIGHMAVGGEMGNLFSSTNDPLFFIHHGGIDHFWYQWQSRNKTRFADIRRSIIDFHRLDEPIPEARIEGITTLDSPVFQTGEFAPLITISQVMDTINEDGNGFLCYVYDSEYVDFSGTPVANALPNGGRANPNAYPSVSPLPQPLAPWSGQVPEDGGDMGLDTVGSGSGHHHHEGAGPMDPNMTMNMSDMPSASKTAVIPTVVAKETIMPTQTPIATEKPKVSMGNPGTNNFLGFGAQLGSVVQLGSGSSYDPNYPIQPLGQYQGSLSQQPQQSDMQQQYQHQKELQPQPQPQSWGYSNPSLQQTNQPWYDGYATQYEAQPEFLQSMESEDL